MAVTGGRPRSRAKRGRRGKTFVVDRRVCLHDHCRVDSSDEARASCQYPSLLAGQVAVGVGMKAVETEFARRSRCCAVSLWFSTMITSHRGQSAGTPPTSDFSCSVPCPCRVASCVLPKGLSAFLAKSAHLIWQLATSVLPRSPQANETLAARVLCHEQWPSQSLMK